MEQQLLRINMQTGPKIATLGDNERCESQAELQQLDVAS